MDPPVSDPDKINNQKEAGPSFHCHLYDTQLVHKISLTFLPGLATACVDNTTGDIFKTPGSVAADVKQEMIQYLNHRSETFVADHILLSSSSEIEPSSHDPYDVVSDFVDDFATSKRNLFSRVSGWLLSERREDNIDDFAQEMEVSGFWLNDHIEGIAQTLLKNVDFKGLSHCEMKFQTRGELEEHVLTCGYRTMDCGNEGCNAVFCANQRESHDSVCSFKIIPCEQGCLESGGIMRREMDRHCITVCTMKLVNCAFRGVGCLDDVRQCEVQQHYLDNVGSHLMCVLKGMYKEASLDDLKPRAEQIQQLSTRLSEARNARALTNLVKEIDAKLGALVIKTKNKPDNTEKKALEEEAETKGKPDTVGSLEKTAGEKTSEDEVVLREAVALADDAMVEEVGKKVSEAEKVSKEGELKAQKLLEMDEFIKEGEDNSAADLEERTETKAPEVVVMDQDKEEEKSPETRTNETRGVETEVSDMMEEENNKEAKISDETKSEAPSEIVMDKEENEEGAETKQIRTIETKGVETEVNDVIEQENNKGTKISAETKSEALMDKKENDEGAETKQTRTNETSGVETEVNDVIEEENNRETKISDETKREAPSRIVMDKEENEEGAETNNSSASASDEAEALSKSSEGFSKAQAETEPNFS